jgi:methylated-DNA-protein-cysteine methyltransferase-like protein
MTDDFERIYALVRQIPHGRVTTYGQLGAMCRITDSRVVGEAMHAARDVPWQRVINARGQISLKGSTGRKQRELLEAEGVVFDERGSVDFTRVGWTPDETWLTANGYAVPAPLVRPKKSDEDAGEDQLSLL